MTPKEAYQKEKSDYINKLIDLLLQDPTASDSDKKYAQEHLKDYLCEMQNDGTSLLHSLTIAMEQYLDL